MVIYIIISQDFCHVRMTDIEGFLTIYGHSEKLLNNKLYYYVYMLYTVMYRKANPSKTFMLPMVHAQVYVYMLYIIILCYNVPNKTVFLDFFNNRYPTFSYKYSYSKWLTSFQTSLMTWMT